MYLEDEEFTTCVIDGMKDSSAYSTVEQQYVAFKEDGRTMSPEALEKMTKIVSGKIYLLKSLAISLSLTKYPSLSCTSPSISSSMSSSSHSSSILQANVTAS